MQYKQEVNGKKAELRTENILLDNFDLHKITPDFEGRDFMVELKYDTLEQYRKAKEKIQVYGIIQAKFFEGKNEVKIAKEYVEDEEDVRTDFFALIHTDDEDNKEICYFFTASEINEHFRIRPDLKTRKENYIFSLSKERQFEKFKDISKAEINRRIEEGIRSTEEYRNQKFIKEIEEKYKNPKKRIFDDSNQKLFERIKGKHIVDKLYIALNEYQDFRRITAWRLIDKISFKETHRTSTTYNQFILRTNNKEIIDFFNNIEIGNSVTIRNKTFFKGVTELKHKINRIIDILNENGIVHLYPSNKDKTVSIRKTLNYSCNCAKCNYYKLNFYKVEKILNNEPPNSGSHWENMQRAYSFFLLGDYEKAKKIYSSISEKSKQDKDFIIYFFTKYNLRIIAWRSWDNEYPYLSIELEKLHVSKEKQNILKSLSDHTFFYDYSKVIDDIYLKIKDYKQRRVVNDTKSLVNRLYAKFVEYLNFTEGNWLLINISDEFDFMVEKVIESCIISYSMKTEYTYHLNSLNDFLVEFAIHHCDPNKLLGYFQRNDVSKISYHSDNDYFKKCLINFFSQENVDFLYSEIEYFKGRTKNPDLRRKTNKIFENLCILLAYLDIDITINRLLEAISYFIEKLDFNIHEVSILAHPILKKPNLFTNNELLHLINVIIQKENYCEGYLLSNCLYCLKEKGYIFNSTSEHLVNSIIKVSLKYPQYGLLNVLPNLLSTGKAQELKKHIFESLNTTFNPVLYYESVISGCLEDPVKFFDSYLEFINPFLKKEKIPDFLFRTSSPYTGIIWRLRNKLNNLIEIVYIINESNFKEKPLMTKVEDQHPYYKFLLNIESYKEGDPFNVLWLLENQSDIILKKISKNKQLKDTLKKELESIYNKEIGKIFIKYFVD